MPTEQASPAPKLRGLVGVDVTFHTQSAGRDITVLAPIIRGVFPVQSWTLEPELPAVVYDFSGVGVVTALGYETRPNDSGVVLGNPTFTAKHHWLAGGRDFYLGPGITLPLAQPSANDEVETSALVVALASRGVWNVWWYLPRTLTVFFPLGVRHVSPDGLDVGGEAALAALFHVGSGSGDTLGAAQAEVHLGYASSSVEAGAKLRLVRLPGEGGGDHGQMSFEPYARALLKSAYVGGGFLINLDEPFGPMLDRGSVWGLHLEGGVRL